jgi:hypothetical protein
MREMREKRVGEMGPVRGYRLFLEDMLLAWDKYQVHIYTHYIALLIDLTCLLRCRTWIRQPRVVEG